MIEIIIMIGVVWNACLQTYWFYWTLKNHSHKHIENNPENLTNSLEGYVATPKNKNQDKFVTGTLATKDIRGYTPVPKSKEEVFGAERKYDPSTIKGQFDSFFEPTPPGEE